MSKYSNVEFAVEAARTYEMRTGQGPSSWRFASGVRVERTHIAKNAWSSDWFTVTDKRRPAGERVVGRKLTLEQVNAILVEG